MTEILISDPEALFLDFFKIDKYRERLSSMAVSGGKSIVVGGERSPAFYTFENPIPHPPVISFDVFDSKVPLAKAVKTHVEDVLEDPAAWAKLSVDKFGADMITLHLISIDPLKPKPSTPKEAGTRTRKPTTWAGTRTTRTSRRW